MRYIRIFSELSNQIRYATQKRVLMEIALIKLCKPQMERDYDSLALRIAQLEKKMEEGIPVSYSAGAEVSMGQVDYATAKDGASVSNSGDISGTSVLRPQLPEAIPEDVQQVIKNWRSVIEGLSGGLKNYLRLARPSLSEGGQLLI